MFIAMVILICFFVVTILIAELWKGAIEAKESIVREEVRALKHYYFMYKTGCQVNRDNALDLAYTLTLEDKDVPNNILLGFLKEAKAKRRGDAGETIIRLDQDI